MRPHRTNPELGARRDARLLRAVQARRDLQPPRPRGRAWINGREVGDRDLRYSYLEETHD